MTDKKVRVRFAPSPTGGLHLGGVRTVLFNYLFAKKNNGDFVLRIEDTDQTRYVEGAEQYIMDCLAWCGLTPDEGPLVGGKYAPYRQSERKPIYREYAEKLVMDGHAYYAFDTAEELDKCRKEIPNFQYGQAYRHTLRNSLSLSQHEVDALLDAGAPHVIRIKMPTDENISFTDMIRGHVSFDTNLVDDKVLLKADGMPTYHLAVVVDDRLMNITHAFRGEEWLPSAPVHLLLWKYLGWEADMPQWAHLPLILKPDGHGKLSKRDGARLGFPVFAMNWFDAKTDELTPGFREIGFLPEAFVNLLAVLGWNDGTDQELFSMDELVEKFSIDRVSKAGAKFDFEKAKWFNAEWIKKSEAVSLKSNVAEVLADKGIVVEDEQYLLTVIDLIKDRVTLLPDFYTQSIYFFESPKEYDLAAVKPKWTDAKTTFFKAWADKISAMETYEATGLEADFKAFMEEQGFKMGDVMLPFRIMLVGGKFGPHVFDIAALLGKDETVSRIEKALGAFTA
ncbi:glutamate--tRNA ligase [Mucilaginibacter myungsuensis]|uniref:Glutamate--tRNA ligase n=1 Tax=Mucilaginibacter myungsuensis TaxID=649104 RepID=A0A929KVU1_9SPHI|nr:glutamate--tRNA ligase [Mucilaginibacter myungsuensis]MBE9661390.1 glutamate--tRNA ligase [Mucilaginibacter myungsuensis]MDN3597533.1 glutamate--tRNA ligase [Mucilaginibacter myungsuensis]